VIGTGFVQTYRGALAARFIGQSVAQSCWRAAIWLTKSREYTNFTYPISQLSRRYIASALAIALSSEFREVLDYFDEIESDDTLKDHIRNAARSNIDGRYVDKQVHFGRRIAWYAAIRLMRPNLVVETGVDRGLGSCILTAALARNASEGHPGYYYGTDINPAAGFLLSGPYAEHGRILYGDSIESLRGIRKPIDLLVNDSDHSAGYEAREYDEVRQKLSPRALIIGDNCEVTDALLNFSIQNNREFIFVREDSVNCIDPGTGIGLSYRRKSHDPCGS
jgi:predicted O-methyltransferase YrrM